MQTLHAYEFRPQYIYIYIYIDNNNTDSGD